MHLALLGDSLTAGGSWVSKSLAQRLAEKYPLMDVVNLGVGGDATVNMSTRKADADLYGPFRVWVWGGINDVWAGFSAATIETNLQTIYTYYAGKGYEVWALTITPRDDNDAARIAVRDAVNTWIKTTATGVTKVVDAFTVIADPTDTDVRLTAYADPGSQNHLNDVGMDAIVAAADN